jgi:hypothetical protein
MKRSGLRATAILAAFLLLLPAAIPSLADGDSASSSAELAGGFAQPPPSARPWVYWFWLNGNVTRAGITADLEAMRRVGIGGVLIMSVDQGAPAGPLAFGSPAWIEMFRFACSEASRLGLQVNMTNDAGWCGSGGPWITPELSMQKLVWTTTALAGPGHVENELAAPKKIAGFYRDVAVIAFPTPANPTPLPHLAAATFLERKEVAAPMVAYPALPPAAIVPAGQVLDLTADFKDGQLAWNVPPGRWTVLRLGHTSTGVLNHPAPKGGLGLECDKLSQAAADAMFAGLMDKLIAAVGPLAGPTLVSTHIDSWEVGSQNWTADFPAQFRARRGYDLQRWLPVLTGQVVDSLEVSQRFLWDFRRTIAEMLNDNYAGPIEKLAREKGLRLSIEAYGDGPMDNISYGGRADEPMGEYWWPTLNSASSVRDMVFAGHTYGKRIIGAESFTASTDEKWLSSPALLKPLGDWAFCTGINRFVIHRYAMQPWLDRAPGMAMGPWGQHYERTQTWWEETLPWHTYLARCQYLLRQGLFHADICYLQPEGAPVSIPGLGPAGDNRPPYNYDGCTPEVVLTRMSVKDTRLVLPDGMSYRVLVLPDSRTMTPVLLDKIASLVRAGATVIGPRPEKSPSLTDYPACDAQLKSVAAQVWGDCDGVAIRQHAFGLGRVVWGRTANDVLAEAGVPADLQVDPQLAPWLDYIHRVLPNGDDLYFIANRREAAIDGTATFGVTGKSPAFWWPETGRIEPAAAWRDNGHATGIPLHLVANQSVFVVFAAGGASRDPVAAITLDRQPLAALANAGVSTIVIHKAIYGVPGDPSRSRNVLIHAQILARTVHLIHVTDMAKPVDPAPHVVKTLTLDVTVNGEPRILTGQDNGTIDLGGTGATSIAGLQATDRGDVLEAWRGGHYQLTTASGKTLDEDVSAPPPNQPIDGSWQVTFPPGGGAPPQITLPRLESWSQSTVPGVNYFSGTAVYRTTFTLDPERLAAGSGLYLDLGQVDVMARVTLNGRDLGTLWKPPYRVDIAGAAQPGENRLEVDVTNLWINRMIGDEHLPEDSVRKGGDIQAWPDWLLQDKPSPTGRYTFTTWRLWNKNSPLQESGLIGPVTLQFSRRVSLPAGF